MHTYTYVSCQTQLIVPIFFKITYGTSLVPPRFH